jgi:hypothetical protein
MSGSCKQEGMTADKLLERFSNDMNMQTATKPFQQYQLTFQTFQKLLQQ